MEEIIKLAEDKNISSDKRVDKIKKAWCGGILCPSIQKNLYQLFELIEALSIYQLVLDRKIDEKYGQPFYKLSKRWKNEMG